MAATLIAVLESDLRNLSSEARRKYPALKDAAERGMLKLRSVTDVAAIAKSDEVLKTFLLACETKNVKLSAIGLACMQKLIAHDAVSPAALPAILTTLVEQSEVPDESVQLKTLQTSLSVLQSSLHPEREEDVAAILGICFRLQGNARCADSVHSTASASIRQAIALMFDHVVEAEHLPSTDQRVNVRRMSGHIIPGSGAIIPGMPSREPSIKFSIQSKGTDSSDGDSAASREGISAPARLGLKLFEDLISLAGGGPASWLHVPSLPRAFSIDILDWVLSHYVAVFTVLPPYSQILRQRVCSLLMHSLRSTGEVEEGTGEPPVRRLLLRCVGTVTRYYCRVVMTECEVFLQMLIKAVESDIPIWNRIMVLEILRGLCTEARVLRKIFEIFDMRPSNTNVVQDMANSLAKVVAVIQIPDLTEETMNAVASLFTSKAKGVEWTVECDTTGNPLLAAVNEAQAITLAVDALLGMVFTISTLADEAVDAGELDLLHAADGPGSPSHAELGSYNGVEAKNTSEGAREQEAISLGWRCRRMVDAVWRTLLEALSLMLSKSASEAVVLEILRGYQAFATACGVLRSVEARNAFLASLCNFTLATKLETETPVGASAMLGPAGVLKRTEGMETPGSVVLTSKNVQALRTLFNVSHRLDSVLGPAWVLVLETLAALDRTLHAPHATTQELSTLARLGSSLGSSPEFTILSTLDAQLFESTSHMADSAVLAVLEALRQVSKGAVGGVTSGLGMAASGITAERGTQAAPKMFAVERMVETMLHNLHRIDRLWGKVTSHLLELSDHDSREVRMAALDALDRCITAALSSQLVKDQASLVHTAAQPGSHSFGLSPRGSDSGPGTSTLPGSLTDDAGAPPTWVSTTDSSLPPRPGNGIGHAGATHGRLAHLPVGGVMPASLAHGPGSVGRPRALPDTAAEAHTGVPPRTENSTAGSEPEPFECVVVATLTTLYAVGRDSEMKGGALRGVLHILERHGERLLYSWPNVLKLLLQVAAQAEKDLVPVAFQSVRLVMNDCLSSMPSSCLRTCVEVAGAYSAQLADLNISLTAITLLWTTADFFAKQTHGSASSLPSMVTRPSLPPPPISPSPSEGTGGDVTLSPHSPVTQLALSGSISDGLDQLLKLEPPTEALLQAIFQELRGLGSDERPEVRNSAIRTLFASLVSHGGKLSAGMWRWCVWQLVFPLLDDIRHLAATSSKDEWVGRELGKQGGKAVHMLVHHSRNTAQKQWDETLVVFFNGVTKLLKPFFSVFLPMEGFDEGWIKLLHFSGENIITGSKETALAAVNSLFVVLQAHALKGHMPREYWEAAFDTLELAVRSSALEESRVALKARIELVECMGKLYTQCNTSFEPEDLLRVLAMVDVLARYPALKEDSAAWTPGTLPQLQRTVLDTLPQLRPSSPRHSFLWSLVLFQLLAYLPGGDCLRPQHTQVPEQFRRTSSSASLPESGSTPPSTTQVESDRRAGPPPTPATGNGSPMGETDAATGRCSAAGPGSQDGYALTTEGALSPLFAERVAVLVGEWYGQAAEDAQTKTLPYVVGALGRCMKTRRDLPDGQLWRTGVTSFTQVVATAFTLPPASKGHTEHPSHAQPDHSLHAIASVGRADTLSAGKESQRLWRELADLFEEFLLGACGKPPAGPAGALSAEGIRADEQLEMKCLDALCDRVLAHCDRAPEEVTRRLVAVIDRCAARTSALPLDTILPPNCGRFSLACLTKLFAICGRGAAGDTLESAAVTVGRIALPILVARCKAILESYALAESASGDCPLPQIRHLELICMLQELARLCLHPLTAAVIDIPLGPRDRLGLAGNGLVRTAEGRTSWRDEQGHRLGWERAHLLLLYAPLCEMMLSRDPQVRELTLVLFRLIGGELGLILDLSTPPP